MKAFTTPFTVELDSLDAALVLRQDGEMELILPQRKDDEHLPEDEVALIAVATKFRDERLRDLLSELLGKPRH